VKPLFWVASAKKDLLEMPDQVVDLVGYALYLAQCNLKHSQAKPLKGFGSAGVLEVLEDDDGNTYRAVYIISDSVIESMFCTASRRNHERVLRCRNRIWI